MRSLKVITDRFLSAKLSGTVFRWNDILNLMVPGVLDSLSIMFINMLITALISKNGEASIAAVALVGPITGLVVNLFNGISAGGTVVVAQCCGKNDEAMKKRSIGLTICLTVFSGLVVCVPMLIFPQELLSLLYPTAEMDVMSKSITFLSGSLWSVIVFTLYTAIFAILRGLGESRRCLILSLVINVAYLLLSILFLNVLKMDILGSVYALFLARLIGTLCALIALFGWRPPIRFSFREMFRYDRPMLRSITKVGIPLSFEQMFISLSGIVSGMYMIVLGTTALATNAIINSLIGLLYAPAMSIGSLSVTVVGRCVGAGKTDEAIRYGKIANQLAMLLVVLFGCIFYPMLPILLQQYNPSTQVCADATVLLYASIPALLIFWPASFTMPHTLRACSDTLFPSVLSLSVLWIVTIGLGYVFSIIAGLGLWGIWIANWLAWAVRSIGFRIRFRQKKWDTLESLLS